MFAGEMKSLPITCYLIAASPSQLSVKSVSIATVTASHLTFYKVSEHCYCDDFTPDFTRMCHASKEPSALPRLVCCGADL